MAKTGKKRSYKKIRIGPAGFPPAFFKAHRKREKVFEWLAGLGLDAMEYQATFGAKTKQEKAEQFGGLARGHGIKMSLHGPYFISLGSAKADVRERSIERVKRSMRLVKWLGGDRVIFHPGFGKGTREETLELIIKNLKRVEKECGIEGVFLYPETGGKKSSIGTTEDLVTICKEVKIARPCIDWAHEHARNNGSLNTKKDFLAVLSRLEKGLGKKILADLHCHWSPIDYTNAGEKAHLAFKKPPKNGKALQPDYRLMLDALMEKRIAPVIICESSDSQDKGATAMMKYYGQKRPGA